MELYLLPPELLGKHFAKETKSAFLQAQASGRLENISIQEYYHINYISKYKEAGSTTWPSFWTHMLFTFLQTQIC